MSSRIIKKENIDFNKKIEITSLPNPAIVNSHLKRIKEIYPNKSDNEINTMLNNVVFRDVAFSTIMDYIVTLFDFEFDQVDIDRIIALPWFQEQVKMMQQNDTNVDKKLIEYEAAKQEIRKVLLFDELINILDINFSDEEFDILINNYYEDTNLSIREWKKNPEAREGAKRTLLNEKLVNKLIQVFVNLDPTPYFKQLEELNKYAASQMQNQNKNSNSNSNN